MKTASISLITLILAGALSACSQWHNCPRAKGDIITEDRQTGDFSTVEMQTSGDVFITVDPEIDAPEVRVETHESIMENVETRVTGSRLVIDTDPCVRRMKTLNVYLVVSDLRAINVNGSADIHGQNTFMLDKLNIDINGSGNVDLDAESDEITVDIHGSGDVKLQGHATHGTFDINGSGDIRAFGLQLNECFIEISGSGSCNVDVSDFLSVDISGSGDVVYQGQPRTDISISGSGDVRPY